MLVFANEGALEDSIVTTVEKSIAFNASGTRRAGSWRRRTAGLLMTPGCCAHQMLITECVTSQPKACDPLLQQLIDFGYWTTSENL